MASGPIEIEIDSRRVRDALARLAAHSSNLRPALTEIGEVLIESTKKRFETSEAPDGTPWAANRPATRKHGIDKPLVGETRSLANLINFDVGSDRVSIGSPMEYAAMQQFGGTKSEFPHLWGNIPARPFLGLSSADEREVLDIIEAHLAEALGAR